MKAAADSSKSGTKREKEGLAANHTLDIVGLVRENIIVQFFKIQKFR